MNIKRHLPKVLSVICLVAGASLGRIYYQNSRVPQLGVTDGRFEPLGSKPNGVSTQTADGAKSVDTLPFKADAEATMKAIEETVASIEGSDIKTRTDEYLYAVFTTPTMKFHDDAEFWIDVDQSKVHFRSESRAGYSDMGLNRRRYERIAERYSNL